MLFFTTSLNSNNSFTLINLHQITKVEFQTLITQFDKLTGCSIHLVDGTHHHLTHEEDLHALLELLQGKEQALITEEISITL